MRYLWQHIEQILALYDGSLPLHHFLKDYFRKNPKLGSRDRRGLSDAVYAWYRCSKAFMFDEHGDEILRLAAMYLSGLHPKAFATFVPEDWGIPSKNIRERIDLLQGEGYEVDPEQLFPFDIEFSAGITADGWRASLLRQPHLFLRIRSQKADVAEKLQTAGIQHKWLTQTCVAMPNGTNVDELLPADSYVVQDASSQATGKYLHAQAKEQWWDCCAGAGGKSLMLKDAAPQTELLTTDVRPAILHNLQERFKLYHHPLSEAMTVDAADAGALAGSLGNRRFNGIICDVPCTGSGTWSRTPESCYFFDPASVSIYAAKQKAILRNASKYLAEGGRLIYITCSVFREENEEVIEDVTPGQQLRIASASLINGSYMGADALFAAELVRA